MKTQDQQMINIEIQLSNQHDMFKRTLFYWAQLYTSQLQKGMGYYKLKVYEKIYHELEELAMKDEHLLQAFNVWEELSLSQEDVIAYQSRLKYILDEEAKLEDVKHMAEQKGIEETKEEIANNLLVNNMDIDFISKITGLSVERIEEIKERLIQNNDDQQR
ncbi:PD-(D/E)XK nuclease family transposase [Lysinibacillus agricola]|uniref:PD-(D/E)XK nuclease family transposase n=1 Tax=Lysinibacillus agricola TaxID=2590012 RepID=UPI003C1C015E